MKLRFFKQNQRASAPTYQSSGASGCDVCACVDSRVFLEPAARMAIPTGLCVEIPMGFEIQVRPRSGLAFKEGLTVINAPGTIDSDYRGELKVLVVNLGSKPIVIEHGMRIAQLVLCPVYRIEWEEATGLEQTQRGTGGFGSTGSH